MAFLPKQSVVVSTDFSDGSVDAIRLAREFVATDAALHIVHVLLPLDNLSPASIWGTLDESKRLESTKQYFAEYITKNQLGGVHIETRVGDPGWEIAEYARAVKADLIIVPSHGYHGLKRVLLGSVAEHVIRHADCPVLVLRRPDAE